MSAAVTSLDVLIPCYNYARFLPRCVASVLSQSRDDVRVLIIDDCSTDDSWLVARSLMQSDSRVRAYSHAQNRGHIATYNEGIDWASAPFFLLLSADDMLAPGAAARALGVMERHPDVVLTHGASFDLAPGMPVPRGDEDADGPWRIQSGMSFIADRCRTARNPVDTATCILRTTAQRQAGHYRPELPHSGDLEMWLRLAALGAVAETSALQAIRSIHGNNMSLTTQKGVLRDYAQREAAFDCFFRHLGTEWPESETLQRLARRRLGEQAFWTGVSKWLSGDRALARDILAFACRLRPSTRYLPPLHSIVRVPHAEERIMNALSAAFHVRTGSNG